MGLYTLAVSTASGRHGFIRTQFSSDTAAVEGARHVLSHEVLSVSVVRGDVPSETSLLGIWEWEHGAACWRPVG